MQPETDSPTAEEPLIEAVEEAEPMQGMLMFTLTGPPSTAGLLPSSCHSAFTLASRHKYVPARALSGSSVYGLLLATVSLRARDTLPFA